MGGWQEHIVEECEMGNTVVVIFEKFYILPFISLVLFV